MLSYHSCHICGTWKNIQDWGYWAASHKGMGSFLWGKLTLENLCKDFNLAIGGGLGWIEWLKNGTGNGFIYHVIIPELYTLW